MQESKSLDDRKIAETGETLASRDEGLRPLRSIYRRRDPRGFDGPAESGGDHDDLLASLHALDVDASSDLVGRAVFQCDHVLHHVDELDSPGRLVGRFRRKRDTRRAQNSRRDEHAEHFTHGHGLSLRAGSQQASTPACGALMASSMNGRSHAQPSLWWPPDSGTNGMTLPPKMSDRETLVAPPSSVFLTTFTICCAPGGPIGMTMMPPVRSCCRSGGGMW